MAIIIELSSNFGEYLFYCRPPFSSISQQSHSSCHCDQTKASVSCMKACNKKLKVATKNAGYLRRRRRRHSVALLSLCARPRRRWAGEQAGRPAGFFLLLSISGPCHRRCRAKLLSLGNQAKCFQLLDLLISPSHRSPTSASVRIRKHLIASAWCTVMRA